MTTDEAQLVSAVSMLKALGVEEQADIEARLYINDAEQQKINMILWLLMGKRKQQLREAYAVEECATAGMELPLVGSVRRLLPNSQYVKNTRDLAFMLYLRSKEETRSCDRQTTKAGTREHVGTLNALPVPGSLYTIVLLHRLGRPRLWCGSEPLQGAPSGLLTSRDQSLVGRIPGPETYPNIRPRRLSPHSNMMRNCGSGADAVLFRRGRGGRAGRGRHPDDGGVQGAGP